MTSNRASVYSSILDGCCGIVACRAAVRSNGSVIACRFGFFEVEERLKFIDEASYCIFSYPCRITKRENEKGQGC